MGVFERASPKCRRWLVSQRLPPAVLPSCCALTMPTAACPRKLNISPSFPVRLVVFQDLDNPAVVATFGEIMCTTYKAFGAVGLVTNGPGRDLDQVRAINFPTFTDGAMLLSPRSASIAFRDNIAGIDT